MVLFIVGIGLGDVEDITLKGLKTVKKCNHVYLDAYTSILSYGMDKRELEEFYGKQIIHADREMLEDATVLVEKASNDEVCLLVVGDPFSATTHSSIVEQARCSGVRVEIVHNASIITAVGCCGLQLYRFGEIVSIVTWSKDWRPESFYDKIEANFKRGLHTLCLLDIKTKEQTIENIIRGCEIYEEPSFMTCSSAAMELIEIYERRTSNGVQCAISHDSLCVGLARIGWGNEKIVFCTLDQMCQTDMGNPLHSLIIPGQMHDMELEMLNQFSSSKNDFS